MIYHLLLQDRIFFQAENFEDSPGNDFKYMKQDKYIFTVT